MTGKDTYNSGPEAVKIGILSDMPDILNRAKRRTAELVRARYASRLDRPVEFVVHEFHGAPSSSTRNAIEGFRTLAEQGCVVVVGCNHSDNCRVQLAEADRLRVPLISLGASEDLVSEYGFTVGWGSIPHDAYLLANWCKANKRARVTVTSDRAWHCQEYLRHFRLACARWDIRILSEALFSEFTGAEQDKQAQDYLREHRGLNPDAIVHFGSSTAAETWALAVHESGWDVPRAMNAVFFRISQPRGETIVAEGNDRRERIWAAREGWHGTSVVDEENPVLAGALRDYQAMFHEKPSAIDGMANYYDAFRVAIEGVALTHLLSPQGVRDALERLKYLPAAAGGASTTVGFGPWDHMGIKGKDQYVLRRIENGKTVLAFRYDTSV
jgi:branched-chain amino acid transport system substrate-binding protein